MPRFILWLKRRSKSVAAVLIAVVQERVLAALPSQVWNRVTSKRLLPDSFG